MGYFELDLISERTKASLEAARARGRNGGAPYKMTAAKLRLAQVAMENKKTKISELCKELGITRQTLYRHVSPDGELINDGKNGVFAPFHLMYVGITRARKRLIINHAKQRQLYGTTLHKKPSVFLGEIPTQLGIHRRTNFW